MIEITPKKRWNISLLLVLAMAGVIAGLSSIIDINHDNAIAYDSGLRHLAGQRIYKDFYIPSGPLPGLVFALFLLLSPTGGIALLSISAITNIIATFCVWKLVFVATKSNFYAIVGAVLTEFWYLIHVGSFYQDSFAYLLVLVSATLFVSKIHSPYKELMIGVFTALAFYCKQSTGIMASLSLFLAILISGEIPYICSRKFLNISLSYIITHLLALLAIYYFSDLQGFFYYTIILPSQRLYSTPSKNPLNFIIIWFAPFLVNPIKMLRNLNFQQITFYPVVLLIYFSYFTTFLKRKIIFREKVLLFIFSFLLISTLLSGAYLQRGFADIVFAIGGLISIILWLWREKISESISKWILLFFVLISLTQLTWSRTISRPNIVHGKYDFWPAQFKGISSTSIQLDNPSDLLSVIDFMQTKRGNYAFLDSKAYLIPLALGRASSNPPQFYALGLTIPTDPLKQNEWQENYISALKDVRYVIDALDGGGGKFGDLYPIGMPRIRTYLKTSFSPVFKAGNIIVYEKN